MSSSKDATLTRYPRQSSCLAIALPILFFVGCATTPLSKYNQSADLLPPVTADSPAAAAAESHSDIKGSTGKVQLPSDRMEPTVVRGQNGEEPAANDSFDAFYDDRPRQPMPVSGGDSVENRDQQVFDANVEPVQYGAPYDTSGRGDYGDPDNYPPPGSYPRRIGPPTIRPGDIGFGDGPDYAESSQPFTGRYADLEVNVQEQQTGRFMFGVGVNSDAGLTAQVVVDEYNFDWRRFPRGVEDVMNGTAFRGGGQRLRIEAVPGSQLQRYMINFTEPYLVLGGHQFSLNLSGYLYDRRYFDWDEQRLGGRVGLGYRLTPDLTLNTNIRMENVNINDPRIRGVTELEEVLGDSSLFTGTVAIRHDTRDSPFAPTEGHLIDLSFEQAFGTFSYPRGTAEYRRFFLLRERIDGSGRHVLGTSLQAGFSGSDTPLYEHFFAGGYSTIRGFRFRGASPKVNDVTVGGEFSLLGSFEYLFPITADDMLKGVVFCDYGTIEEEIEINKEDFRVAVGAGLRVTVPAMGPAPIALDLAIPIAREDTDRIQNFSFFVGLGR
ncbi:MAG: BamA/TamA family outer membrane protein [Planctomycetales bacterium]|nr:BamA/TamA family outer membrane protein [Planctomycetales bacterium]